MTRVSPSQQDLQGTDKLERVIRDLYARLNSLEQQIAAIKAQLQRLQQGG